MINYLKYELELLGNFESSEKEIRDIVLNKLCQLMHQLAQDKITRIEIEFLEAKNIRPKSEL